MCASSVRGTVESNTENYILGYCITVELPRRDIRTTYTDEFWAYLLHNLPDGAAMLIADGENRVVDIVHGKFSEVFVVH